MLKSVNIFRNEQNKKRFFPPSRKMFRCSTIFRNKFNPIISDPVLFFHSDTETKVRDKVIKEIFGGLSQTEVPALVCAADTYAKINQGMRKYSSPNNDDGGGEEGEQKNQNQQQFNPELVRYKHSVLAPVMFHSYRKIRVVSGFSLLHCRRQFDSTTSKNEIIQQQREETITRNLSSSSTSTSYDQLNSHFRKSSSIQSTFGGLVLRIQMGKVNNNYGNISSSYLNEKHCFLKMKNDPNESLLMRQTTLQPQGNTNKKNTSDWEQRIVDIISCPQNEKIASYLLMEKIIREVLLPYIHTQTTQTRLSISMKQLLLDTNLHKYSTSLGSHLVLEKELLKLGGGDKRCLKNYSDDDDGVALVAPGLIVSLKAKLWVEWMEKNSTRKVTDLLFGKENGMLINSKSLLRKKNVFPLCLQPSLYDALVVNEKDEKVSKFRCDLLDLGYTLSSDLKEMVKV